MTSPYTTESRFPDGSLRRYAGIHRPPFDYPELRRQKEEDGTVFMSHVGAQQFLEWWKDGEFDVPLYWLEPEERA